MSQIIKFENDDVQYVLGGGELVLDSSQLTEDVVYSDGSQTIVVNGHFLQSDGQQTIVLHEGDDITQYYINNENGTYSQVADQANKCFSEVLITDNNELEGIASMEDGNIVQYVEDEDNSQGDVIYITDDQQLITMPEFKVKNLEQDNVNCDPQIVDIDDLIQQQQSEGETGVMSNSTEYQYAILKDGKLHIQTYDPDAIVENTYEEPENSSEDLDLSKITGKNLITGQTVTLHGYIDKLQRKNVEMLATNTNHRRQKNDLDKLLHKKLMLCKTNDGKRLVGKIIHVEKNSRKPEANGTPQVVEPEPVAASTGAEAMVHRVEEFAEDELIVDSALNEDSIEETVIEEPKLDETIGPESEDMEHISRTLAGLMDMDTVKKKLFSRIIRVRLIEKRTVEDKIRKRIVLTYGYMSNQSKVSDEDIWSFVPCDNESMRSWDMVYITIQVTIDRFGQRKIKVLLNDDYECSVCTRKFPSLLKLKKHTETCRSSDCTCPPGKKVAKSMQCTHCTKRFAKSSELQEHKKLHDGSYYKCYACGRAFSRYSNLMRHIAIHKGQEANYKCDMCGSSYNFMSSLTRHIVQHHISKDRTASEGTSS